MLCCLLLSLQLPIPLLVMAVQLVLLKRMLVSKQVPVQMHLAN